MSALVCALFHVVSIRWAWCVTALQDLRSHIVRCASLRHNSKFLRELWWRSCYVMLAQVPWSSSSPQRPPCGSWPRCIFKPFQDFHKQKFKKGMCKICNFFAISTIRYDRSFLRLVPSQSRSLWLGPHLHQNHSKLLKIIPKHAVLRHVETRCSLWQRPTYWLQYIANFHATSTHLHFAMV